MLQREVERPIARESIALWIAITLAITAATVIVVSAVVTHTRIDDRRAAELRALRVHTDGK